MLSYKDYIIPTISLFFRSHNDIDIFIEDSDDEEFYGSLFNRLLDSKQISKIISCRGKNKLIKACENDQSVRDRRRIYIADGDLDLIFDNNHKNLKHLFILDRYCIENYLLNETGIIETLHDIIITEKSKIAKQLGFSNWLKKISNPLIELFLHYSILHELNSGCKTVSKKVSNFCTQKSGITVLENYKVEKEVNDLIQLICEKIDEDKYYEMIYDRRQKWPSNINTLLTIVSGKDYILPLLVFRFKKLRGKENYTLKYEALRMRLVKTCDLQPLNELKKSIINS